MDDRPPSFAEQARKPQRGLLREFIDFALHNKKWWLTPILILVLLVSFLVVVGGSGAAPFIYSLF